MAQINRHDYSKTQREFLSLAVSSENIDATELMVLGANTGGDFAAIADYVLDCAYVNQSTEESYTNRCKLVEMFDAICVEQIEAVAR